MKNKKNIVSNYKELTSLGGILFVCLVSSNVFVAKSAVASDNGNSFSVREWKSELSASQKSNVKSISEKIKVAPSKAGNSDLNALQILEGILNFGTIEAKVFNPSKISSDREIIQKARLLFEAKKFPDAIREYQKIPKTSDYWLDAIEERAWCSIQVGDYEKALGQVRTLMAPMFASSIGSEPFFLKAFAELRICDYKNVFATLKLFKLEQKQRIKAINGLTESGDSKDLQAAIERIDQFPIDFVEVGIAQKVLPRLFYRDRRIQVELLKYKLVKNALEAQDENALTSKASGFVAAHRNELAVVEAQSLKNVKSRVRELAKAEANEYYLGLQKLQLIEVEVTQRVFTDANRKIESSGRSYHGEDDDIMFLDNGEVWLDELDKYKAEVNACPTNLRRRM